MKPVNHDTNNPFVVFLTGTALAVALGLTFALSTPAFAMGGGGGGGSAPAAPKITKAKDLVARSRDEEVPIPAASESKTKEPEEESLAVKDADEDKTPNKPDERTNNFPGPEAPQVVEAVVGFTAASATRIEEGGTAKLYIALSEALSEAVVLSLRLGGTATEGSDYSLLDKVSIPQGTRSADVDVSIQDDTVSESDETITITLQGSLPQGVSFGTRSHIVTIPANDQVEETPEVVANPEPEDEDKPENKPDERTVEIPKDGDTETKPVDKVEKPDDEDPPNKPEQKIDPTAEKEVEETVPVSVGFDASIVTQVVEGETATLRIVFSEPISKRLTLPLYVSGDITREDFFLPRAGRITFPEGSDSGEIVLSILDDSQIEFDEVITFDLEAHDLPDGMVIGNGSHTITIVDDDRTEASEVADGLPEHVDSVVGFKLSTSEIPEGNNRAVLIEAHVTPPVSEPIRLSYKISGSATKLNDWDTQSDYMVMWRNTWIPEDTANANAVQLMVFDDIVDDDDETITFTISGELPEGVKFGTRTHTVTIIDDDDGNADGDVTVGFAKSTTAFFEDVGSVAVEVVLSEALDEPLTVTYGVKSKPPAWSGRHNKAIDIYWVSSSLTFQPGETSKSFLFDIADDRLDEAPRKYGIYTLSGDLPEGVRFGKKTHALFSYDNDPENGLVLEDHREGMYVKEYDGLGISLINEEDVVKMEAQHRNHNKDARISIENSGTVRTDMIARMRSSRSNGLISMKNGVNGVIGGNVIGKHHGEGNILIENRGRIGGDIRAVHFKNGDVLIENVKSGTVERDIEATHYGVGDISIINRDYVRTVNIRHLGSGVVRYNGDINNRLSIVGNYEGSDDRQLNFHVRSDSDYAQMDVEGDVTGQSSVSLIVGRNANIGKDTHFPELIVVDSNYDAPSGSFTGEQTIGAFDYVLEYHKDDSHEEHVWEFVNKGLSDTAQENAKIPDNTKKDINTPPATDPDKKKELGLWGGADSSHTDIGLSFPAFVSNDDYHVGSHVQYYLKEGRTGIRALVETEYDFDIMNFRITPHARLTWTRVGFDDFVGPNRERVSLVDGDTVDLGLGLSFDNEYQISNGLARIYGGANLLSPLDGETSVRISGFTIVNEQDDLSVDGQLGLSYEWGEGYAVHGEVSTLRNDDAEEIRANLGLDIDF